MTMEIDICPLSSNLTLGCSRTPAGSHVYRHGFTPQIPTPAGLKNLPTFPEMALYAEFGRFLASNSISIPSLATVSLILGISLERKTIEL